MAQLSLVEVAVELGSSETLLPVVAVELGYFERQGTVDKLVAPAAAEQGNPPARNCTHH